MRDSNRKLILIGLLVMICLLGVYKVTRSYNIQKVEVAKNEDEELADLGSRTSCNTIDYTKCGCYNIPADNYSAREQCFRGCNYCSTCNAGSELDGNYCYKSDDADSKITCKIASVKEVNGKKNVETGGSYKIAYSLTGTCVGYTVTASIYNGSGSLQSAATSGYYNAVAGQCGKESRVTIILKKGSKAVGSSSYSVNVLGTWKTEAAYEKNPTCTSKSCAEQEGSKSPGEYYSDPENGVYGLRHYRGCGGKAAPKACYGNNRLLSLATSAKWLPSNQLDSAHRIKIEGITNEKDCVVPKSSSFCEPKNIAVSVQEKNASVCEDDKGVTLTTKDGYNCSNKPFYTILCDNTVTTKFDNGDDGEIITTVNQIYAGQGFKFGVNVTTKRTCTATFNGSYWKEAYNYNKARIDLINKDLKRKITNDEKTKLTKDLNMYENKQDDLKNLVKKYNNFDPARSYTENTTLSVSYQVGKKNTSVTSNFITTTIQKGEGTYSNKNTVKLGVSGVTNPISYRWTNESKPSVIKLIPPKTYLNSNGEVSNKGIDGGNKIYVDYYATPGTYTMNVKVSGLGGNNIVNNKKCKLKVIDQEIIYRPIDVSNPFINNKWTPGTNWVNDLFDFRNVIKADIWKN